MQTEAQKHAKNEICVMLYNKIAAFVFQFGYAPSIREMRVMMGISTNSMIHGYLKVLSDWGWIAIESQKARTLRLTRPTEHDMSPDQGKALFGSVGDAFSGHDADVIKVQVQRKSISQEVKMSRVERKIEMMRHIRNQNAIRSQIEPYKGGKS